MNSRFIKTLRWLVRRNTDVTVYRTTSTTSNNLPSPLAGIRVLDLTRVLAGPYCTMILGDLGAEIIKVEHPVGGDDVRNWGPPFLDNNHNNNSSNTNNVRESAYFLSVNRNKKSVCVNIKHKDGQDIVRDLAKKCDVLVENYLPGKLDALGLGYESLSAVAPKLVYCSITGFGRDGPYADRAGYDVIAASLGGLMHVTGPADGPPCKVGVALTDLCTGLYAHGAIVAALYQRDTVTGVGMRVECNLLSTQMATLANLGSNYLNAGQGAGRLGTAHHSIVPYQSFRAKDGHWMTVGCGNDRHFADFCARMNLPQLSSDPRFVTNELRVKNRDVLLALLEARFAERDVDEWGTEFEGAGFPYGTVNTLERAFADPQVRHLDTVKEVWHPALGRAVKQVAPAVRYSGARNEVRAPPPPLGQHTDHVLKELLNVSQSRMTEYRRDGVIS